METAKKSTKKGSKSDNMGVIRSHYKEFVLLHGKRPSSVYKFCLDIGIKEEEFYKFYGSFDSIEKSIWKELIDSTTHKLEADKTFSNFTAREQILTFYFALCEAFKAERSFILQQLDQQGKIPMQIPAFLKDFRKSFESFIEKTLSSGKESGEISQRPYLDKKYPQLFWAHMLLLLQFWKEDDSAEFEKTDAFIEKSVNLAFDLIGKGAVDSAMDFAKFLFQAKFN